MATTQKKQKNSEIVYVRFPKKLRQELRADANKRNLSEANVLRLAYEEDLRRRAEQEANRPGDGGR